MMKTIFLLIEDFFWAQRCRYNLWLHGPYGLAKVVERIPFRFLVKYLRRYGATVGENCRFERGLKIHRPLGKKPFENLIIGNDVYLGHNILIDLTRRVTIHDKALLGAGCYLWTHTGYYTSNSFEKPDYVEEYGEVTIKEGTIVYSGAVISCGITVGSFSQIGANSLVNIDVAPETFVGGVPAKEKKVLYQASGK